MAEDLFSKGEWQTLRQTGGDPPSAPPKTDAEIVASSVPEPIPLSPEIEGSGEEDGWQSLRTTEGESPSFDPLAVGEEEIRRDFPGMVEDSPEACTDEQRQSLQEKISALTTPEKFRLALFANREVRSLLIADPKKIVSLAVLKNARMNESEILHYAQRKNLSEEVIAAIAKDPKWQRHYPIRLAVVANPKTPLSTALSLLPQLQERDLKNLCRDKNVVPVLRRRAQELCAARNHK